MRAALFLLSLPACAAAAANSPLDDAITALLAKMTVAEKARQLVIQDGTQIVTNGEFDENKASSWLKTVGAGVLDSLGRNVDPRLWNQVQRSVVNASRHDIGAIQAEECQHGVQELLARACHNSSL